MDTFRRSIARGPAGEPHKVLLKSLTRWLQFDNDAPVQAPDICYAVRLGVDISGNRVALLATAAGDAITVNDRGLELGRWKGVGGYGWAAIRRDLVYAQRMPAAGSNSTTVDIFDVRGMPTEFHFDDVPYSSMGMLTIAPDGTPVMAFGQQSTIDNVVFVNAVTDGEVTVGQVDALRRGGIGVKVGSNPLLMVERTAGFDGYTNLFPEVLDLGPGEKPWIALNGSDAWSETPEPDAVTLVPYRALPDIEFLLPPRPVHLVPGDLIWGVDIEGDHWAYDLYVQGTPAPLLFHDSRVPLDAPIATVNGETVTTLWLADKTGAAILYYHDRNVDPENVAEMAAWMTALDAAQMLNGRRAFYIGVNAYPRLQANGATFGALDTVFCVEKMLDACRARQLEAFLFTAGWGGNQVGNPPHLAYPEGDLARTLIELIVTVNGFANVVGVVRFGEGRNDVSAWCEAFFRAWKQRLVGWAFPPLRRSIVPPIVIPPPVVVMPPAPPTPPPAPPTGHHTTGQQKATIAAGAGLIGTLVAWIIRKVRRHRES